MAFNPSANSIAQAMQKARTTKPNYSQNPNLRLGVVSSSYSATDAIVSVTFDGEDTGVNLIAAVPVFANDRVIVTRAGNTWVITGNITTPKSIIGKTKPAATSRATQTLAADPDLSITLNPGSWIVECDLVYTASVVGQIQTSWTFPADTISGVRQTMGPGSTATNIRGTGGTTRWGSHNPPTAIQYAGDAAGYVDFREWAWISTAAGGTVTLNWARGTTDSTATVLQASSTMKATRLN